MRLYMFEHCSLCFRVRMTAALKGVHLQERVVLDDDSDFKLTEAMPDNESTTLRQNSERQEALHFLMENLRPRERKVLDLRFGLTGNGTHSLRQIGHLLRISKERVRQIQNRALEKLRASAERVGWEPSLLLG